MFIGCPFEYPPQGRFNATGSLTEHLPGIQPLAHPGFLSDAVGLSSQLEMREQGDCFYIKSARISLT